MNSNSACKICTLNVPPGYELIETDRWRIRHSEETNILGYFILEPRRHFLDLSEADADELAEYSIQLASIMRAQRQILRCERVYTFSLAEAVPHFHVHVIPRKKEFPRAFKGRGIMSYPLKPAADPALVDTLVNQVRLQIRRHFAEN